MLDISNFFRTLENEAHSKINIENFMKEIESRFKNMQEEKVYTIDRFEGDLAVCEDRKTKEMINIKRKDLPEDSREGSILKLKNGKFELDLEEEEKVEKRIKEKMDNLWNN
ncbi:MAG: DUF3006 domain-containing protein [Christensenellales bacterium]